MNTQLKEIQFYASYYIDETVKVTLSIGAGIIGGVVGGAAVIGKVDRFMTHMPRGTVIHDFRVVNEGSISSNVTRSLVSIATPLIGGFCSGIFYGISIGQGAYKLLSYYFPSQDHLAPIERLWPDAPFNSIKNDLPGDQQDQEISD